MNAALAEELASLISASRLTAVALAARRISEGQELLLNADTPFHPASIFKLCVMMEIFRQVHLGRMALNDLVAVTNEFRSIADGSSFSLEIADDSEKELYSLLGQGVRRGDLVNRMIVRSSNLATNVLMNELDPQQITAFMHELGADSLIVRRGVEDNRAYRLGLNNSATARGLLNVLLKLARHEVVSVAASIEMISILEQQQFNQMIPALLPAGARVAHKTGWTADYHHDAGIVYPPGGEAFVLCIFTKGYTEAEDAAAHACIDSLAKKIYEAWA